MSRTHPTWVILLDSPDSCNAISVIFLSVDKSAPLETRDFPTQGVFIFVGHIPNTYLVKDIVDMDDHDLIQVDLWMQTKVPGLFACGDCRTEPARQMASSVGDGVTAAVAAIKYVDEQKAEETDSKVTSAS